MLPQSKSFDVLKTRLECINLAQFSVAFNDEEEEQKLSVEEEAEKQKKNKEEIVQCLKNFDVQQERFKKYINEQLEKSGKSLDLVSSANVGGYAGIRVNNSGGYGLGKNGFGIGINSNQS